MMSPEQKRIFKEACNKAKAEKGYVPAELQVLPTFIALAENGMIDICEDKEADLIFIKSKHK